ncbi:MAG TPA: long-chain fatty acid--CoA ligase [Aggregatilineales bacterium]|nr:long-chain fatty acid--CoA ligase [Anaerolineales bacterium]HRE46128.1 long-chain fatty acid--CoA ligase [Aggregatilineales bacterium]
MLQPSPQSSHYVTDWLERRAALTPNRIALQDTLIGRDLTYSAWNAVTNQTAHFLSDLGVRKGDRVAVYATNRTEYLEVWHACGKLGAILQNVNWRLALPEVDHLLKDASPTVILYSGEFAAQIETLRPTLTTVREYVAFDPPYHRTLPFEKRLSFPTTAPDRPSLTLDDTWVICYTGGTTGLPKGALLTHGNMTWNSVNTVTSWGLDANDVGIISTPLFHTGALNVFTLPLIHVGGKSILCQRFDSNQIFDLIETGGVTVFFGVPTMFLALQQHPRWESADFSRLKIVISGGAPCPMPIFERFWAKGVDFKTGYGLTEAGPNTFWLPPEDVRRKPGAVGRPLIHVDVRVVRSDGSDCAADEPGELIIRGAHVTPGYWNNPTATAEAIREGWLHTGDLAKCDSEGYYTIVGRLKEMIISGGENIYPAEVESVLFAHPAIAAAALIGIPDPTWGEVGRAIVVLEVGRTLTVDELVQFLRERLAGYKVPKSIRFVNELPQTGAGKVDKQLLAHLYGG